jgi:hypothetical protein
MTVRSQSDVRLRQVVVAALDAGVVVDQLCTTFGLCGSYQDPGVAEFGLENHVYVLGGQFLELGAPVSAEAPVRRFLEKKGRQAAGYMVVLEVGGVAPYRARAAAQGRRIVLDSDGPTWSTLHLHPRDMGLVVSVDQDKGGDWMPAGLDWPERSGAGALTGIAAVRIATDDPDAMAGRWAAFLDMPYSSGTRLQLQQGAIDFVSSAHGKEGLLAVDVMAKEGGRVGERHTIAGTEFELVGTPQIVGPPR